MNTDYNDLLAWSLSSWEDRHRRGYFPKSKQHKDWGVYQFPHAELLAHAVPTHTDTALEIGCGYGEWMIPLAPHVKSIDGFDIHPEPLAKAQELFKTHKINNCSVRLGSGDQIPFIKEYSLIYSISVFQHLPKAITKQYLVETARRLSPTGRCFHHFRSTIQAGFAKPEEDITIEHKGDFSCGWSPEELYKAAYEAKLHNVLVIEDNAFNYLLAENRI